MPEAIKNPLTPYERFQKGPSRRAMVILFVGNFLFLIVPGVFSLWYSIFEAQTILERALFLALAVVALAIPILLVGGLCRRKWKTGRWMPTPEERMELRAKSAGKTLPKWLNPVMAATYILVIAVGVISAVRKPFDVWNYIFLPVWITLAAQLFWQMRRDRRTTPPSV
jgi:MFS family permease